MSKNPLDKIIGGVNDQIGHKKAPFHKGTESSTAVQIRNSIYNKIRVIAFKEHRSVLEVASDAIKYALDHHAI